MGKNLALRPLISIPARNGVPASGDVGFELLTIHLDLLDETAARFSGALKGDRERGTRDAGRVRIIEAALTGMAERGRGEEAKALLMREPIAGRRSRSGRDG